MRNAVFLEVTLCGFLRTKVSEESIPSIINVERISDLGTKHFANSFHIYNGGDIFPETSVLI
jgi:hypothetical protein